ncbi:MAG TPA: hypothetical protein VF808_13630 [Ktedonobacterales bacterium]
MDKHARLDSALIAWRSLVSWIRVAISLTAARVAWALRSARWLLARSEIWTWRFALLPIAACASALLATGRALAWQPLAVEALAAICALTGWAMARALASGRRGEGPFLGMAITFFVVAGVLALTLLVGRGAAQLTLGVTAAFTLALDLTQARERDRGKVWLRWLTHRIMTPALLGLGLVVVTTVTQGSAMTPALWLLGAALSFLLFSVVQARETVVSGARSEPHARRSGALPVVGALALACALIIALALIPGAPHAALFALLAAPIAIVAADGMSRSTYVPARAWAARRLGLVFTVASGCIALGALASAGVALATQLIMQLIGG